MNRMTTMNSRTSAFLVVLNLVVSLVRESKQSDEYIDLQLSKQVDVEVYLKKYGYLSNEQISPSNLKQKKRALRMFQEFFKINVTGEEDEVTLKHMSKPRCGLADISVESLQTSRPKWDTNQITWKFLNYSQKLSTLAIRSAVKKSFQFWADVSSLSFSENKKAAMIQISFQSGNHGDISPFDGPSGVLAHAYFPGVYELSGDTHFDEDEDWVFFSETGINIIQVATHEFGHALGLHHSSNDQAVMIPIYPGYIPNFMLHIDDIKQIQAIYGPPFNK